MEQRANSMITLYSTASTTELKINGLTVCLKVKQGPPRNVLRVNGRQDEFEILRSAVFTSSFTIKNPGSKTHSQVFQRIRILRETVPLLTP